MLFDNESESYLAVIIFRGCSIANPSALNLVEALLDIFSVTLRFFRFNADLNFHLFKLSPTYTLVVYK